MAYNYNEDQRKRQKEEAEAKAAVRKGKEYSFLENVYANTMTTCVMGLIGYAFVSFTKGLDR